jgi:hypothetical protein
MKRLRGAAALGLLAVLSTTATGVGTERGVANRVEAYEAQNSDGSMPVHPVPADEERSGEWNRPDPESSNDAGVQVDLEALSERMRKEFPDRFAAVWVEGEDAASVVVVGIVGLTAEDARRARAASERPERTKAVAARYSEKDLARFRAAVSEVLADAPGPWLTGTDPVGQRVVVEATFLSDEAQARLDQAVPADALIVDIGDGRGVIDRGHGDPNSWASSNFEAGLNVNIQNVNSTIVQGCTTSFKVHSDAYGFFGLTAGHCGRLDASVKAPLGIFSDKIRANLYYAADPATADSALTLLPSANYNAAIDTRGGHRSVVSLYGSTGVGVGVNVCFIGRTSINNNCGPVRSPVDIQARNPEDGRRVNNIWCIGYPAYDGDSGGPTYTVNSNGTAKAAGVVFGARILSDGTREMCYSNISDVLSGHGVKLVVEQVTTT